MKTEEITARYTQVERETDVFGRVIGVRRLSPSRIMRIDELAPGLSGTFELRDPENGQVVEVPMRGRMYVCASVCEVDGAPLPFPRTREALDSIVDMLDNEGFVAASRALGRLGPVSADVSEVKNS